MKSKLYRPAKYGAIAMLVALTMGCASTADLKEVRGMAEEAMQKADQAMQMAQEAKEAASASGAAANQANIKADQALRAAQDVDEKVERMFKKAMQK